MKTVDNGSGTNITEMFLYGRLNVKSSQYVTDDTVNFGIHLHNSDIIGVNEIRMNDAGEGIQFSVGEEKADERVGLALDGSSNLVLNLNKANQNPDGKFIITGGDSDCVVEIHADSENNDEDKNPLIHLFQDGDAVDGRIGLSGDNPGYTDSRTNALFIESDTDSSLPIQLVTGQAARVTILGNGKVGIGQNNPTATLDVNGNIAINGNEVNNAHNLAWTDATLKNNWVNYGGTYEVARYKMVNGVVYIEGMVKDGDDNSTIFTLPSFMHPSKNIIFSTISGGSVKRLDVRSNGDVKLIGSTSTWLTVTVSFSL